MMSISTLLKCRTKISITGAYLGYNVPDKEAVKVSSLLRYHLSIDNLR